MKKILLLTFGLLALSGVLGYVILHNPRGAGNIRNTLADETNSLTLDEVAKHSTKKDCWMAIEGKVYNITAFIPMHPGGSIIALGCGKDATRLFNMRPGSGTSHSRRARAMLSKYYLGDLAS